jgi:hypothetical protein
MEQPAEPAPASAQAPATPPEPVVHIRGIAYKGTIEASTRPPGKADGNPAISS